MDKLNIKHYQNILMIILILIIPQLAVAILIPSLNKISNVFGVSMASIIYSYLIGLGIGEFFWGTFSDCIGRRKLLLIAVALFAISSVIITLDTNAYMLISMRLIQGFSAGAYFSLTTAIMTDQAKNTKELVSNITLSEVGFGSAWLILPIIGSVASSNWQLNFYIMAGFVVIVTMLAWKYLSETHEIESRTPVVQNIKDFFLMFADMKYLCLALLILLPNVFFLAFNTATPNIVLHVMHDSPVILGYLTSMLGLFYCSGIILNVLYFRKTESNKIFKTALTCFAVLSAFLIFCSYNFSSIYMMFALVGAIVLCWSILFPHITAQAMSIYPKQAGTCASNFGFIFRMGSGVGLWMYGLIFFNTYTDVSLFIGICAVLSIFLLLMLFKKGTVYNER